MKLIVASCSEEESTKNAPTAVGDHGLATHFDFFIFRLLLLVSLPQTGGGGEEGNEKEEENEIVTHIFFADFCGKNA